MNGQYQNKCTPKDHCKFRCIKFHYNKKQKTSVANNNLSIELPNDEVCPSTHSG